jgi:hypothetical protein
MLRVFVSSTSEDLREYRAAAREVVLDLQWHPVMMEHFEADVRPTVEACCAKVADCHLVVLLQAFRQGWVPKPEEGGDGTQSITALELAAARKRRIDALAFLATDGTWPGKFWDDTDAARGWVKKFRNGLNLPAKFFDWEAPGSGLQVFKAKLREALVAYQRTLPAANAGVDEYARARADLLNGGAILFFGSGVHGNGPLGARAIANGLRGEAAQGQIEESLATTAEYCERHRGSRGNFLDALRGVLQAQRDAATVPAIYQVAGEALARAVANPARKRPVLVVSGSWDMLLEEQLAPLKPTIVAHVIRSEESAHDREIVVIPAEGEPRICLADELLDEKRCVIYKPLGSPFLNDRFDADLDIDTVVATEADHLTFLGGLQHQYTQIPTSVAPRLRKEPLIFLGYPLDVWHYRLVAQVFQNMGRRDAKSSIFSVREPQGAMEELAWQQLHASLIRMEPDAFAKRLIADREAERAVVAAGAGG